MCETLTLLLSIMSKTLSFSEQLTQKSSKSYLVHLIGKKRGAADKWEDKITENFKIGLKSKRWKFEIICTHTVHLESGKWKWTHSFGKFVNPQELLLILKCFLVDGFWRKVADFCEICQVSVTCPLTTLTLQLRLARLIEGKSKINKQKIK